MGRRGFRRTRDIIDEFSHMYPWAAKSVEDYQALKTGEIIFTLETGEVVQYDPVLKTAVVAKSMEDLIDRYFPTNEDRWIKEFANRLYRTMKAKGMSQEELCWASDISRGAMSNYISGQTSPSVAYLIRIARAMDLSGDELLRLLCYR